MKSRVSGSMFSISSIEGFKGLLVIKLKRNILRIIIVSDYYVLSIKSGRPAVCAPRGGCRSSDPPPIDSQKQRTHTVQIEVSLFVSQLLIKMVEVIVFELLDEFGWEFSFNGHIRWVLSITAAENSPTMKKTLNLQGLKFRKKS